MNVWFERWPTFEQLFILDLFQKMEKRKNIEYRCFGRWPVCRHRNEGAQMVGYIWRKRNVAENVYRPIYGYSFFNLCSNLRWTLRFECCIWKSIDTRLVRTERTLNSGSCCRAFIISFLYVGCWIIPLKIEALWLPLLWTMPLFPFQFETSALEVLLY